MDTYLGIVAALTSAASWAFGTVVFESIGKTMPNAGITFVKSFLSIVLIASMAVFHGGLEQVVLRDAFVLSLSGILGIAIGDTLFFVSLQDLGAKVQVLYFMLGQVVTMVMSFLLLGDVLVVGQYVGAIILLFAIVVVTWGKQEDHPNKVRGIVLGLISIVCFSVSTILIKYTDTEIDVISATFYRMLSGTVVMIVVGTASGNIVSWLRPLKNVSTLVLFVLNVVVITVGGFMLSMYSIQHLSVSLASVLATTEPVFVIFIAFLIKKERIKFREGMGAMIAITGLLILIFSGQ